MAEPSILCIILAVILIAMTIINIVLGMYRGARKKASSVNAAALDYASHPNLNLFLALFIASFGLFAVCRIFYQNELSEQKTAAPSNVVHLKAYSITLPKRAPIGYEGGKVELASINDSGDSKLPKMHLADWSINSVSNHASHPIHGGIEFMVNEHSPAGLIPENWQTPNNWKKVVRSLAGTKIISGINFTAYRVTAELDGSQDSHTIAKGDGNNAVDDKHSSLSDKIIGMEYLARDDGNLIGIRSYNCGSEQNTNHLADSALSSFHKSKPKSDLSSRNTKTAYFHTKRHTY